MFKKLRQEWQYLKDYYSLAGLKAGTEVEGMIYPNGNRCNLHLLIL